MIESKITSSTHYYGNHFDTRTQKKLKEGEIQEQIEAKQNKMKQMKQRQKQDKDDQRRFMPYKQEITL